MSCALHLVGSQVKIQRLSKWLSLNEKAWLGHSELLGFRSTLFSTELPSLESFLHRISLEFLITHFRVNPYFPSSFIFSDYKFFKSETAWNAQCFVLHN